MKRKKRLFTVLLLTPVLALGCGLFSAQDPSEAVFQASCYAAALRGAVPRETIEKVAAGDLDVGSAFLQSNLSPAAVVATYDALKLCTPLAKVE